MLRGCSHIYALLLLPPATAAALPPCGVPGALLALLHDRGTCERLRHEVLMQEMCAYWLCSSGEKPTSSRKTSYASGTQHRPSGSHVMQPEGAIGNNCRFQLSPISHLHGVARWDVPHDQ